MATKVERVQSIVDAVFNTNVPPARLERLGRAVVARDIDLPDYDTLTNGQRAGAVIDALHAFLLGIVRDHEAGQAARDALAAQSETVATDFTQVP